MKIKNILISQPKPETEKSPYFDLAKKYNLKLEFRPFIKVERIPKKDFKQTKINIADYTAIIFNSKVSIEHFFGMCEDMRVPINEGWKYFCFSETIANYLQKHITFRKRKIFYGNGTIDDLMEDIKRFPDENYLVPLSDVHKQDISEKLTSVNINFTKAILHRTVPADVSDVNIDDYQVLVFFSPVGVASLKQNFPDFEQGETCIGAFGPTTASMVENLNLRLDIKAPIPEAPSITAALDLFLKERIVK